MRTPLILSAPSSFAPTPTISLLPGDALTVLQTMPDASVQCVVTSPPYWGLRDYGTATWEGGEGGKACDHKGAPLARNRERSYLHALTRIASIASERRRRRKDLCGKCGARRVDAQLGLEPTPALYVEHLVEVFREVRRVLRDDGTCWLNLGDSYAGHNLPGWRDGNEAKNGGVSNKNGVGYVVGLKPKDLVGIPWRVAFALQADGWYLRSDIIWAKLNPMPEGITGRPTKAHEYLFLLTKSARYYYDSEAVKEPGWAGNPNVNGEVGHPLPTDNIGGRNKRTVWKAGPDDVWEMTTQRFKGAHFAVMPQSLVAPCILAGTSAHGCCAACGAPYQRRVEGVGNPARLSSDPIPKEIHDKGSTTLIPTETQMYQYSAWLAAHPSRTVGWDATCSCNASMVPCTVLDPFVGSGTVPFVARSLGRSSIGIDLNQEYIALARQRLGLRIARTPMVDRRVRVPML